MKPLKNIQIKTTPQHRTQNQGQFEEADPTSKDRKIIKMRNVVDLGDQEDGRKTAKRQQEEGYDDQLLEQLDQWVENQISKKKAFNFDLIKADNKQPLDQEFNNDSGPTINQAILNQIMKPTERIQMRDDNNQQDDDVQVKFQMLKNNNMYKTLDQVRIEMNKKILNSLLFYKVTKKLDELQINRKSKSSWNIQKMDEETTQVFREQSQALKIKTLNNFKGLTEYFSNPAQYIDYDVVLTKAKHHSNRPPASFPTMIPQSQQTTHSSRALMESYSQFQTQIKEHKSLLFSMRVENNEYVQTCTKREEEISNIKRKFYQKEEKTKQGWIPDQETNRKRTLMDTIEKIRQQRDQEIKVVQKEITGLKNQIQQNNEKQNIIQKELDELRQKKRRCKMLLKDIFLKQFNESNYQLVPDGLISVIKNMRKINENAKVEYFPKFLIEESKQYLMKASQLEFEIEDIRQQQQKQNPSSMNRTPQQKVAFGPQQVLTVTNIKNQVKQMMKKNKVTIKKPVFVQGLDPLNPSQYAHVIKWENQDLEPHQAMEQIESQFKLQNVPTEQNISSHKDLNQRLVHCQQELERIQKEEQNRIMKLYQNKRNLSDVQELKMVLYCLFGQNIGDQLWYQFVVEWTDQKSINPQQILKEERGQSQRDDRSTLPQVPQHMQSKMFETYRNLTQITNVDYNFNLIQ